MVKTPKPKNTYAPKTPQSTEMIEEARPGINTKGILMVTHDLSQAKRFECEPLVLGNGNLQP